MVGNDRGSTLSDAPKCHSLYPFFQYSQYSRSQLIAPRITAHFCYGIPNRYVYGPAEKLGVVAPPQITARNTLADGVCNSLASTVLLFLFYLSVFLTLFTSTVFLPLCTSLPRLSLIYFSPSDLADRGSQHNTNVHVRVLTHWVVSSPYVPTGAPMSYPPDILICVTRCVLYICCYMKPRVLSCFCVLSCFHTLAGRDVVHPSCVSARFCPAVGDIKRGSGLSRSWGLDCSTRCGSSRFVFGLCTLCSLGTCLVSHF